MRLSRIIPLWFGVLKIKHREQLLYEERHGHVPVWAIGDYRLVWRAHEESDGRAVLSHTAPQVVSAERGRMRDGPRKPAIFVVTFRDGQWTIRFDGDYFGPCATREEAVKAAHAMAVAAAAKGLAPEVRLQG